MGKSKVWKLKSVPTAKRKPRTSYSYNLIWVDQQSFIPLKSEHYDIQGKLAKTFFSKKLEQLSGIWISKMMIVVNHNASRMSMMKQSKIKMNSDIPSELLGQKIFTGCWIPRVAIGKG